MIGIAEQSWFPDTVARWGIRRLCDQRLASLDTRTTERLVERMVTAPIAVATDAANDQHYEVPPEFFQLVLGKHLKYSCAFWGPEVVDLDDAERAMLDLTMERAGLEDGMRVLELGCGWGSLTLSMAERFPASTIVAVSNSSPQREFIERCATERGLGNLQVVTADMNTFEAQGRYDRVVSIEMFEHMRNYRRLLKRVSRWLNPDGRLFIHVFCHRDHAYFFEDDGQSDWMARHFFTGGLMPSRDLLALFSDHFEVEQQWDVNGRHYEKTSNAWLARLDERREAALEVFTRCYGPHQAKRWLQRWRLFFMACAESFGYRDGEEWLVGHYLMRPKGQA